MFDFPSLEFFFLTNRMKLYFHSIRETIKEVFQSGGSRVLEPKKILLATEVGLNYKKMSAISFDKHCQRFVQNKFPFIQINSYFRLLASRAGQATIFSFATTTTRQRDNVIEPQRQEKIPKIFRSLCIDGVATTNALILQ